MHVSSARLAELLGDWRAGPGPAHRRLRDLIRLLIQDGRLPLDTGVPVERDLAVALGVSRTTVSAAYAALREEQYLASAARSRSRTRLPRSSVAAADGGPVAIDLSRAAPPAPGEALRRAYDVALETLPRHLPEHGYSTAGVPELREAVAQRFDERGLPTTPDQVMVTGGAMHALGLIAALMLRPRDRVVIDHPTYPAALQTFSAARVRMLPVPLTEAGWDVDLLNSQSREAAMAYLVPDFHNPTGLSMNETARRRLRMSCPIVVDETLAELALDGQRSTPLAAYHPGAITIGSASKTLWSGLRVGWIRAEPQLIEQLARAASPGPGAAVLEQLACADLLKRSSEILPERISELRLRRAHLRAQLADRLPTWTPNQPPGGLSLWCRLPHPLSSALAAVASTHGIRLAAGPRFGVGGAFERHVRVPYTLEPRTTDLGIRALSAAWAEVLAGRRADGAEAPVA